MTRTTFYLFLASICFLTYSSDVYGYYDRETHPQITEVSVSKSKLEYFLIYFLGIENGFRHKFTNEDLAIFKSGSETQAVLDWLKYGSRFEDIASRALNHFHDPLRNTGVDDSIFFSGESALMWAIGPNNSCTARWPDKFFDHKCNDYSYHRAKDAYYAALRSEQEEVRNRKFAILFETLGRVLHLVQDMGVPAHTRNDFYAHLKNEKDGKWIGGVWEKPNEYYDWVDRVKSWTGFGNLYEYWVETTISNELKQNVDNNYTNDLCNLRPPGKANFSTPEQFWDRDVYLLDYANPNNTLAVNGWEISGLAEYTNANFLSLGAPFTDHLPSWLSDKAFPFPRRDSADRIPPTTIPAEDGKYDILLYLHKLRDGEIFDEEPFVAYSYTKPDVDAKGNQSDTASLCYVMTDKVHEAYAKRLLPKTVGYSAGLLDYFFRGKIEATLNEVPVEVDPIEMGIERMTISARNITPGEAMSNGTLDLVVKYRMEAEGPFKYIRKQMADECAIPSDWSEDFYFDLDGDEIPLTAEDITLFLVYRGQLGEEEDGIAVGMIKDPLIPKLVQQPEVVLPESGMYALLDSVPVDPATDGFDRLQFTISDGSGAATPPEDGVVTAGLWYRVSEGNPFQALPLSERPHPKEGFYRQVSDFSGIYDFSNVAVDFDLSAQNLPLWATDVFLYLIYTSQNKAFCVMKDLSEPTPVDFYNYTDRVCLFGSLYDLVDYDGSFDQGAYEAALTAIDTDPTIGNNNNVADEWYIFPVNLKLLIRFSSLGSPQYADYRNVENNTYIVPYEVEPGSNFRLYVIGDKKFSVSHASKGVSIHPDDYRARHYWNVGIRSITGITNQLERLDEPYCVYDPLIFGERCWNYVRHLPSFYQFMGLDSWWLLYFVTTGYPDDSDCPTP